MEGMTDEQVESIMQERKGARERSQYSSADTLRDSLLLQGIMVEDDEHSLNSSWKRLPRLPCVSEDRCLYWLRRDGEFCKQPIAEDSHFCEAHRTTMKGRVPCPLDPKHSVLLTKLAGHMRVCQFSEVDPASTEQPFVKPGINLENKATRDAEGPQRPPIPVGTTDHELYELGGLVRRVLLALWSCGAVELEGERDARDDDTASPEFDISTAVDLACETAEGQVSDFEPPWQSGRLRLRPRPLEVLAPPCCEEAVSVAPASGKRKAKNGRSHVVQQASIAGHLARAGWIALACGPRQRPQHRKRRLCLVEFGAGSARLSALIAKISDEPIASHVLIDRQVVRRAADRSLADGHHGDEDGSPGEAVSSALTSVAVCRVQCDIADLDLGAAVKGLSRDTPDPCSIINGARGVSNDCEVIAIGKHVCGAASDLTLRCCARAEREGKLDFRGVALAFCCHHVCNWSTYVGQSWLSAQGISESDFESLRWFSKLANSQNRQRLKDAASQRSSAGARAAAVRAELGHLSKRLIDEGRLAWLGDVGWSHRLVRFVERDTSPENALLLAWPTAQAPQDDPGAGKAPMQQSESLQ